MAWNSNVPKDSKEKFKDSQPKLIENFEEINTFIEKDHFSFGVAHEGKHAHVKTVTIEIPTTEADEVAFFANMSTELNGPILSCLGESGAAADAIGFSKPYGDIGLITRLPSGIVLYFASVVIPRECGKGNPFRHLDAQIQTTGKNLGFNNVYWAALFIGDTVAPDPGSGNVESDSAAYFVGVPSPNILRFTLWIRAEYSVFGVAKAPCPARIIVIGD